MKIKPIIDTDYVIVNYVFPRNSRCVIEKYNKKGVRVPLDAWMRPVTRWRKILMGLRITHNTDIMVYRTVSSAHKAAEKVLGIKITQFITDYN